MMNVVFFVFNLKCQKKTNKTQKLTKKIKTMSVQVPEINDSANFDLLVTGFEVFNIKQNETLQIIKILSAILHLGNIHFLEEVYILVCTKNKNKNISNRI